MIMQDISIKGLEGTSKSFRLLNMNLKYDMRYLTRDVAEDLTMEMKQRVRVWKGYLKDSIKAEPSEHGHVVKGLFYGRFLESGVTLKGLQQRRSGRYKISIPPKLIGWARARHGSRASSVLVGMLLRGHTMPHPYIDLAFANTIQKLDSLAKRRLEECLSKSGFGGAM